MERQLLIRDVYAREILDPAGNLTIETEVLAGEDAVGRASAPSGVFSGRYHNCTIRTGSCLSSCLFKKMFH